MRQLATVRFYSSDADRISRSSSRSRKTRPDDGDYGIVNVNADNRGLSRALAHRNVRSNASGYQRRQDFFTSHVQWASPAMMASNCRSKSTPLGNGRNGCRYKGRVDRVGCKSPWRDGHQQRHDRLSRSTTWHRAIASRKLEKRVGALLRRLGKSGPPRK